MAGRRYVFLDPDGSLGDAWLYVVVRAATGVVYPHQYGGFACRQGQVEGCLVPVGAPAALNELRDLFERTFRGAGTWNLSWPEEQLSRLRQAVGRIPFYPSDAAVAYTPHQLSFDDSRLVEVDEAWLSVLTPGRPRGVGVVQLRLSQYYGLSPMRTHFGTIRSRHDRSLST